MEKNASHSFPFSKKIARVYPTELFLVDPHERTALMGIFEKNCFKQQDPQSGSCCFQECFFVKREEQGAKLPALLFFRKKLLENIRPFGTDIPNGIISRGWKRMLRILFHFRKKLISHFYK
jgi:hypothetical protein